MALVMSPRSLSPETFKTLCGFGRFLDESPAVFSQIRQAQDLENVAVIAEKCGFSGVTRDLLAEAIQSLAQLIGPEVHLDAAWLDNMGASALLLMLLATGKR
jgi:hypothetical protein